MTFRLPKPTPTSPVKGTVGDVMPHANLINSYKWPAREEVLCPGYLNPGQGDNQTTASRDRSAE